MKYERAILITFLGNYLINNIVAAIVALFHLSGNQYAQYAVYFVLAAIMTALFSWWYFKPLNKSNAVVDGIVFGVIALVVAILTALISGMAGVLAQSGSFAQLITVLPNFWPFIWTWSTGALLAYWVIPAAIVGALLQGGGSKRNAVPPPMI